MDLRLLVSLTFLLSALNYANCSIDGNPESSPTAQSIASSWVNLQISPNAVCYKRFQNVMVKVYEHSKNSKNFTDISEKQYFFSPVGFLDHNSSISSFNNGTQMAELRFRVFMWDETIRKEIIKDCFNNSVRVQQVQVLPFEQVRLFSTTTSASYSLPSNWLPYQQHTFFRFTLQCVSKKDCDMLAIDMRKNPLHFDHLKLQFSMSSQSSRTRETLVRVDVAVSGHMASSLLQRYQTEKEVLLTADDMKKLLKEMTTNIMMQSFDDSEVVSTSSESKVYEILESMLQSAVENTKDMNDRMWESVFWDNDNYRPDKVVKTLNEQYKKLDKETQKRWNKTAKVGVVTDASFSGFFVKVGVKVNVSSDKAESSEDIHKFLHETKENIVWDGEKFVPKPMSLRRLNMAQLRDNKSFQDRKVTIRYTIAILMTPLNILLKPEGRVYDEIKELQSKLQEGFRQQQRQFVCFDVYRTSPFTKIGGVINYEGIAVNVGNAMNIDTGTFTAPLKGVYSFSFNGLFKEGEIYRATMKMNGLVQSTVYAGSTGSRLIPLNMQTILHLNARDTVYVVLESGKIHESNYERFTHFTGMLLSEL